MARDPAEPKNSILQILQVAGPVTAVFAAIDHGGVIPVVRRRMGKFVIQRHW